MKRDITRRDFLHGVALSATAPLVPSLVSAADSGPDPSALDYFAAHGISPLDPRYYPPALTGMRGSHPGAFEAAHALRDGRRVVDDAIHETGEEYDLIVVGAGISGLSASYFYREAMGRGARILMLDNHDDFGGHARRNEFQLGDRLILSYGGTQNLEGVTTYSPVARKLLVDLGVELTKFNQYFDQGFRKAHGLSEAVFFDRETFGTDRLVANAVGFDFPDNALGHSDTQRWQSYLARTPLKEAAQRDILRLQTEPKDYLPGLSREQKTERLRKMSTADFLKNVAGMHPDVISYYLKTTHGGMGAGIDAVDAWAGLFRICPALYDRMDIPLPFPKEGLEEPYIYHFPDGNASIARLLVRSLVPATTPGHTMEDIVTARLDYSQLDQARSPIRIRLNSTAVRVRNLEKRDSRGDGVEVVYMRGGKAQRVRAAHVVLASWNMMIPYMCPEMPQEQRVGLSYCVKVPIVYTSVLVRSWQPLAKLGVGSCFCPGAYFSEVNMDFPVSMGGYHYTQSAQEPAVLHLVRAPARPGLPIKDQYRTGRAELYGTPFEVFEHNVHEQLGRMFGGAGFDTRADIAAITVNRWPHGYAYMASPLWDPDWAPGQEPYVKGRQPFGRIAIANADAGGLAETNVAIDQAHRAVQDILAMRS